MVSGVHEPKGYACLCLRDTDGDVVYEKCIKVKSQGNCCYTLYSCCLHPCLILETILTSVNSKTSIRLKHGMVQ